MATTWTPTTAYVNLPNGCTVTDRDGRVWEMIQPPTSRMLLINWRDRQIVYAKTWDDVALWLNGRDAQLGDINQNV